MSVDEVVRLAASQRYPEVEALIAAQPPASSFSISDATVRMAANLVKAGACRNVLEIGAGRSSVVLAQALAQAGGGRLTSIESTPRFSAEAWSLVRQVEGVDSALLIAPTTLRLTAAGLHYWFDVPRQRLLERGPFDCVLIDAPHQSYGRDASLHLAHPFLSVPAFVVLDDAGRPGERRVVEGWLARYPGLRVLHTSTAEKYGFAVLAMESLATRPVALRAWLQTGLKRLRSRPKVRAQRQLEAGR